MLQERQPKETWKPVVGFEDAYEVSDMGRVRSKDRAVPCRGGATRIMRGRVLVPCKRGDWGYASVCLGKGNSRLVHNLVLLAFVGPRPFPEAEGRHLNLDGWDNRLKNLAWGTRQENMRDVMLAGGRKVTPEQVVSIREDRARGMTGSELSEKYGIHFSYALKIAKGVHHAYIPS